MLQAWQPSRWTRQQLEERREYAGTLLQEGQLSTRQIAELAGVPTSTVRVWRRRLRLHGSLQATHTAGRVPYLTDIQVAEVIELIRAGPDLQRYPDARWTCPRVRELIGQHCGVWYDVDHLSRLLRQWGFSSQKPEKRAAEQDEAAVQTWLEERLPALEKKSRRAKP